jgi:hypothetical protein
MPASSFSNMSQRAGAVGAPTSVNRFDDAESGLQLSPASVLMSSVGFIIAVIGLHLFSRLQVHPPARPTDRPTDRPPILFLSPPSHFLPLPSLRPWTLGLSFRSLPHSTAGM